MGRFSDHNAGGVALLGQGINQGISSALQNYLAMQRQQTYDKYATMAEKNQAVQQGQMREAATSFPPPGSPGVSGEPIPATAMATAAPSPAPLAPGVQVSATPGSANYLDPTLGSPEPMNDGPPSPHFQPRPDATPLPQPMAQAPVGAQALTTSPQSPQSQPPGMKPIEEMSMEELGQMAFDAQRNSRENALQNATDTDMLQKAYHYNTLIQATKPYLDKWHSALNEVRMNPTNKDKWRGVQVLTGEEDPDKAFAMATQEYAKLRQSHDEYQQNYKPLNERLTERGITADQYGDEAKYLEFLNRRKFQPHSPSAGGKGAAGLYRPKSRPALKR